MLSRRHFLHTATAAAGCLIATPSFGFDLMPERKIFLANAHTGETFHDIYWAEGGYIPESMERLNHLLRDHHTDTTTEMAPELIDLLARLRQTCGFAKPIQVTSAYRSRATHAALLRRNPNAVPHSFHIKGKAVDITVPGFNLVKLKRAAVALRGGGVGSYRSSQFVHLDVGPVRVW